VPLLVALALVAGAAPSHAATPHAVAGIHQAYHGVLAANAPRAVKRLYFNGAPQDQVSKLDGIGTATFSPRRQAADQPYVQETSPLAYATSDPAWNSPFLAFWSGPYSGRIDGDVVLRWYWSSANAEDYLIPVPAQVSFWADPTPDGRARLIGRNDVSLQPGGEPMQNIDTVHVSGTVHRSLGISIGSQSIDAGQDLRVSYGSAQTPSEFTIPVGRGPAPVAQRNAAVSYRGPRLEVQSSYIGTQAGEPTIGVDKRGAAFVDGGTLTIDNQVAEGGFTPNVMRSRDAGRHWQSVQPKLPAGQDPHPPTSFDPYVYVDPDTGRVFSVNINVACNHLNYSDDEGKTWTTNDFACGHPVNDHPTLVAGRPPRGVETSGYPKVVYYCVAQAVQAVCARSLDGGDTWLPLPAPSFPNGACGGYHGHLIADPSGRIFIPTAKCGFPWIAISSDGGMSWKRVLVSGIPAYAAQSSVASDTAGNLYYVWYDANRRLPYMSISRDHGNTWGAARMIAPPGVREVNFPSIDASAPGRIAVSFPGTTQLAPPSAPPRNLIDELFGTPNNDFRPWNLYIVESTNALSSNPLFVSATGNPPSDPINRGACGDPISARCGLMFDFLDVQIDSHGRAWATEVDTCTHSHGRSGIDCVKRTKATPDGNPGSDANDGVVVKQLSGPSLHR